MPAKQLEPRLTKEEWRAKREARREKQREANIGRAGKMHQSWLQWTQGAETIVVPARDRTKRQSFHVGCSGWFYWHWRGGFYPANLPTNKWFPHYAGRFRTVELNAPFYSWPTVGVVKSWIRQTARRNFVYTVKVSELITHIKRFSRTKTLIQDFGHIADLLGPRMGCFLFQLPPSFQYSSARLRRIVCQLDPKRRNVVEFRHRSWWNERVYSAFRKEGIIFCSCSGPKLPDELIKTADEIYIRFHGIKQWYRHNYSSEELEMWTQRIQQSGAREVWVYFNNDRDGYATKNATSLLRRLRRTAPDSRV